MSFSDDLEVKILNHIFGKATYTAATNIYVALFVGDPTDTGTGGVEVSGGGYARVSTTPADWNVAAAGSIDNANVITFAKATGSWGTPDYFALYDAVAGNLIGSGAITTPKATTTDDTPSFAAGSIVVTLD